MTHLLALLVGLITIDPDAMTIDPGSSGFNIVTTTTADTATSTSSSSSTVSTAPIPVPVPTTSTTLQTSGTDWYVSVTGSDTTGDGRRATPYKTGNKALTRAKDGDRVVLLDNPDTQSHVAIKVTVAGVTVRCEHEGQCAIITNGVPGVEVTAPRVTIEGIAVKSADNASGMPHNIFAHDTDHVTIRRVIAGWNNRQKNAHPIRFENMKDSAVIESACIQHSRHCISDHGGDRNRYLRNYINGKGRVHLSTIDPATIGGTSRESIACYPCSHALFANNLIEGKEDWGICIEGTQVIPGNRLLGNIAAGSFLGVKVFARPNGYPIDTVVEDLVTSRVGASFDVRDQVSINTVYRRITAFASAGGGFEVDNPLHSSAQLTCTEVSGTPGITIRDSILGKLVVEPCSGKTRGCTISNTVASSSTVMSGCAVSGLSSAIPAGLGDSGAGKGLVVPIDGRGADVRCRIDDNGTRTTENLWAADGSFRFCPPVRAGWNDGAESCGNYAARRLNHKPDGSGIPLASLRCTP